MNTVKMRVCASAKLFQHGKRIRRIRCSGACLCSFSALVLYFCRFSLYVSSTSLKSLGLLSLQSIEDGNVAVINNEQLCYVDSIQMQSLRWHNLSSADQTSVLVRRNMHRDDCGEWIDYIALRLKSLRFSLLHSSAPLFYSRNSQNSVQNTHVCTSVARGCQFNNRKISSQSTVMADT